MDTITLQELKEDLSITWSEEDNKLKRYFKDGVSYLNSKVGHELDAKRDDVKKLAFTYVRYARSNQSQWFEINYISDILDLMLRENV